MNLSVDPESDQEGRGAEWQRHQQDRSSPDNGANEKDRKCTGYYFPARTTHYGDILAGTSAHQRCPTNQTLVRAAGSTKLTYGL